jgi:hypothetical protein
VVVIPLSSSVLGLGLRMISLPPCSLAASSKSERFYPLSTSPYEDEEKNLPVQL